MYIEGKISVGGCRHEAGVLAKGPGPASEGAGHQADFRVEVRVETEARSYLPSWEEGMVGFGT